AARPPARGSGVCRDPQDRPAQRRGPRCPGDGPLRAGETSGSGERAPDSPGPRLRPVDGGTFSRAEPRGSGPERRGGAASAQELDEQAINEYQKALDLNPKAPRLHYRIGRLLLRTGKDADAGGKATEHFQQELAVNPRDAASEYEIGEILRKAHKPDEAVKR